MSEGFRVGAHVHYQRVDEGLLVLETRKLTYIELDSVGADMWEAVCSTDDLEAAVAQITERYDIDTDTARRDLERLTAHWRELGLGTSDDFGSTQAQEDCDTSVSSVAPEPADLYLDLMIKALCGFAPGDVAARGSDILAGLPRLENIRGLIQRALDEEIPGDMMECGVGRGGASIFMRAVLAARQVSDRVVWVADLIAASEDDIRANFAIFGLLDEQVRFVPGCSEDSLSKAPVQQLAVLRLDADLSASTTTALTYLYPMVAPGGFIIIGNYLLGSCRLAVDDYLEAHGLDVALHPIDWNGVWWRKPLGNASPTSNQRTESVSEQQLRTDN